MRRKNAVQVKGSPVDWEAYVDEDDEEALHECEYYELDEEGSYACDTCERDFYSKYQFDKHMSEHRTCNLEGCTFTAHEKIIEKHIRMQHSTGIFEKIKKLNNPEDIAKWIEERKKNYPSKENVEKRYERQEELMKKGIRIQKNDNKFGRDKYRWSSVKKTKKRRRDPPRPPKISLIDQNADWNGTMFPFRGTSELIESEVVEERISDFEDDEWQKDAKAIPAKVNNSLGSLMAAYGSDSEDDVVELKSQHTSAVNSVKGLDAVTQDKSHCVSNVDSDNEPPEEVKIVKTEDHLAEHLSHSKPTGLKTDHVNENRRPRKRLHARSRTFKSRSYANPSEPSTSTGITRQSSDNFPHNNFSRRKVTLLEKLLEKEIRLERNVILQCWIVVVRAHLASDGCSGDRNQHLLERTCTAESNIYVFVYQLNIPVVKQLHNFRGYFTSSRYTLDWISIALNLVDYLTEDNFNAQQLTCLHRVPIELEVELSGSINTSICVLANLAKKIVLCFVVPIVGRVEKTLHVHKQATGEKDLSETVKVTSLKMGIFQSEDFAAYQ
ncbi:hypothetical protein D910_08882, partial [Dendroctonus ponderosae]